MQGLEGAGLREAAADVQEDGAAGQPPRWAEHPGNPAAVPTGNKRPQQGEAEEVGVEAGANGGRKRGPAGSRLRTESEVGDFEPSSANSRQHFQGLGPEPRQATTD